MNDADKWRAWIDAQQLIESELPDGYRIVMEMASGDWSMTLEDDDCNQIEVREWDSTVDFIKQAVRIAKSHKENAK